MNRLAGILGIILCIASMIFFVAAFASINGINMALTLILLILACASGVAGIALGIRASGSVQ